MMDVPESSRSVRPPDLEVIVPVHDEPLDVVLETVDGVLAALAEKHVEVLVVDDGSRPDLGLTLLEGRSKVRLLRHPLNRGYGSAIKTGILSGTAPLLAIIDADGTYPPEELPRLLNALPGHALCIGVRAPGEKSIPWPRRWPKRALNSLAGYFSGRSIPDLNSGLRVFTRDLAAELWTILPEGFSLTSSMTLGALLAGHRVAEVPIAYRQRRGRSSIKPLRDTVRFAFLILHLGSMFSPMKLFLPPAAAVFLLGLGKGLLYDYLLVGRVGMLAATFLLGALQLFMLGMLGELIVHERRWSKRRPPWPGA
ncbi:MAG: hypothetical protein A2284_14015 [Deltaproteobacteria bacterium RIFOXYA12_FULL_61_11]|nr:MAG: hypothetical protein A2284_14015 [Deltaproteobacteria bacterium RIFOXYA12_FULL_61_11]